MVVLVLVVICSTVMRRQGEYQAEKKYKELEKQAKVLKNATSSEELTELEARTKKFKEMQAKLTAAAIKKRRLSETTSDNDSDEDSDLIDFNDDVTISNT